MDRVRWGILGTAAIATERVIPAVRDSALVTIVGIASRDVERAREVVSQAKIPRAYEGYQALLDDPEIEVVYIPLPNHLHLEWCERALAAGKHVLCEKPLGIDTAGVRALIRHRDSAGTLVEEAFAFRSHPQWTAVRALLRRGEIGEIRAVNGTIALASADPNHHRNRRDFGGGALNDLGCYVVSASRFLFEDEPKQALGVMRRDPSFETDCLVSAILDFAAGHALFTASTRGGPAYLGTYQHLEIVGSKGWMYFDFPFSHPRPTSCRLLIGDTRSIGSNPARIVEFDPVDQYRLQAERFSRLVRGETDIVWPLEDAVANAQAIDALRESSLSGQWRSV